MSHRAGFVNIIGHPNSGKSTLLNELVGEKISIVTSKEQTTRHRILAMLNDEEYQIVFSDTPGILEPKYALQGSMMKEIRDVFSDADVLIAMVDLSNPREFDDRIKSQLTGASTPLIILFNKLDLVGQDAAMKLYKNWQKQFSEAEIYIVSALHKHGIEELKNSIVEKLPESPPYFPKDQLTDRNERFLVSEIVRKQIYLFTSQEIPYSAEVVVETFKELDEIIHIHANIIVMRESQKGIIIGDGGKMIKKIGTSARHELEAFFGKKVHIELFVKVDKDWRLKEDKLKKYGYQ